MVRIQHWRPETRAGLALSLGFHVLVAAWLIMSGLFSPKPFVMVAPSVTIETVDPEDVPGAPAPTGPVIEDNGPVAPPPVETVSQPLQQPISDQLPPTVQPSEISKPTVDPVPVTPVEQPSAMDKPQPKPRQPDPTPVVEPASGNQGQGTAAPLTNVEIAGLSFAISACWNLGSTSSEALRTSVTVLVDMAPNGSATNVTLVSSTSMDATATEAAFQSARRAIIRCAGNNRKPLPTARYDAWKQIVMTFDPSKMKAAPLTPPPTSP